MSLDGTDASLATAAGVTADPGAMPGTRTGLRSRRSGRGTAVRVVLLVLFGLFFAVPYAGLLEFSTRGGPDLSSPRTLEFWRAIGSSSTLVSAIAASLELAVITTVVALVLLLPTMVWVRLRLPRLSRVVELLCLLPLTIPAIVLVVGWVPVYLWINYFTPTRYQASPLVLAFAYVVLVLPYLYRTLDSGLQAIDVRTLSEAARSLGAGWGTVMLRVITPNMRAAVLNSALLSVSIVLGEFTVASLLNYLNMQVAIQQIGQENAGVSVAVSAAALLFIFVLLLLLTLANRGPRSSGGRRP